MRKPIASVLAALLVGGSLAFAATTSASATEAPCVPVEAVPAVGEPTITIPNPDYVPAVDASTAWWNFAPNEKGPFEGTPTFPEDANGVWVGPHTEGGPSQELEGVYQQGEGNGSWFYRENTPGSEAIGEPTITVPNPDYVPAVTGVTCPPDDEEPEEPTTYQPACTTVTGAVTLVGGRIEVDGGWDSESIAVPLTGTLADIGTTLNIDASPIQYVGLHIDTAEGTIVFEEEGSYAGNLWSNSTWEGVAPGMGYAAFGSITEYIELNGDVAVTGIRLLYTHPEASATQVASFTIGCTLYTFEPRATAPETETETRTTDATDCEADTVTTTTEGRTTGEPVYDAATNTYTQGAWGEWEVIDTKVREATDAECPPVVVPADPPAAVPAQAPAAAATVTPLAATGGPSGMEWVAAFGALLLASGAAVIARRRVRA